MQYNNTRDTTVSCVVHVWSTQWVWLVGGVFSAVHQNSKVLKTQNRINVKSTTSKSSEYNDVICVQTLLFTYLLHSVSPLEVLHYPERLRLLPLSTEEGEAKVLEFIPHILYQSRQQSVVHRPHPLTCRTRAHAHRWYTG